MFFSFSVLILKILSFVISEAYVSFFWLYSGLYYKIKVVFCEGIIYKEDLSFKIECKRNLHRFFTNAVCYTEEFGIIHFVIEEVKCVGLFFYLKTRESSKYVTAFN